MSPRAHTAFHTATWHNATIVLVVVLAVAHFSMAEELGYNIGYSRTSYSLWEDGEEPMAIDLFGNAVLPSSLYPFLTSVGDPTKANFYFFSIGDVFKEGLTKGFITEKSFENMVGSEDDNVYISKGTVDITQLPAEDRDNNHFVYTHNGKRQEQGDDTMMYYVLTRLTDQIELLKLIDDQYKPVLVPASVKLPKDTIESIATVGIAFRYYIERFLQNTPDYGYPLEGDETLVGIDVTSLSAGKIDESKTNLIVALSIFAVTVVVQIIVFCVPFYKIKCCAARCPTFYSVAFKCCKDEKQESDVLLTPMPDNL